MRRINKYYPVLRPEAGSYVANLAAAIFFVMRRTSTQVTYIDPVTGRSDSADLCVRLAA